jgi:hypothetical protein
MKQWLLRGVTRPRWFGTAVRGFAGLAATLAFALPTTLLLSTQTTSAAPPNSAYQGTVAVVEGTDNSVYIRANLPGVAGYGGVPLGSWFSLGGLDPQGPAAVVDVGGQPLYIAIGTDNALWDRTISTNWSRFDPNFTSCRNSPAAVWSSQSGELFVACQGSNNALFVASTPAVAGQTDFSATLSAWISYGGGMAGGPAIAFPAESGAAVPSFAAMVPGGQVYYHGPNVTDAWVASDWICSGSHLAANSSPSGGWSLASCRGPDNQAWASRFPANEIFLRDAQGGIIKAGAGPGVAWTNDDPADPANMGFSVIYVQGTDNQVYAHTINQGTGGTWTSLGGVVLNGVEAARIVP